jgi:hypothetical protein
MAPNLRRRDFKGPWAINETTSVYFEANLGNSPPHALLTYLISLAEGRTGRHASGAGA